MNGRTVRRALIHPPLLDPPLLEDYTERQAIAPAGRHGAIGPWKLALLWLRAWLDPRPCLVARLIRRRRWDALDDLSRGLTWDA